jgi:hypothetical protein
MASHFPRSDAWFDQVPLTRLGNSSGITNGGSVGSTHTSGSSSTSGSSTHTGTNLSPEKNILEKKKYKVIENNTSETITVRDTITGRLRRILPKTYIKNNTNYMDPRSYFNRNTTNNSSSSGSTSGSSRASSRGSSNGTFSSASNSSDSSSAGSPSGSSSASSSSSPSSCYSSSPEFLSKANEAQGDEARADEERYKEPHQRANEDKLPTSEREQDKLPTSEREQDKLPTSEQLRKQLVNNVVSDMMFQTFPRSGKEIWEPHLETYSALFEALDREKEERETGLFEALEKEEREREKETGLFEALEKEEREREKETADGRSLGSSNSDTPLSSSSSSSGCSSSSTGATHSSSKKKQVNKTKKYAKFDLRVDASYLEWRTERDMEKGRFEYKRNGKKRSRLKFCDDTESESESDEVCTGIPNPHMCQIRRNTNYI